mmetsp:Transcript_65171/g.157755  ORF Transcript_65171/g.157755 Transcript_65171/m.157755 type:complete len:597 (+) Transcript_65171:202-1992(+)
MPRPADGGDISREQLNALRSKFQLLEGDRKAYFETYENTKKQNDELVRSLRDKNKELRKQLAGLQREASTRAGSRDDAEVDKVAADLHGKRQEFDGLKHQSAKLHGQVKRLRDKFADLELEGRKPNTEDSPLTRKIRLLENRLDKAMIKYNEAQSIRKTYEQIVKRLEEERVGFDNQLAAIERTLKAKQHDYEELLLLSGDANHAKEMAIVELERVKAFAKADHERRQRELREKDGLVQSRIDMKDRAAEREKHRKDIVAKAHGDLGEDEEDALRTKLAVEKIQSSKAAEESAEHKKKIDVYEQAFRKIKEATGVSDVNEVIQKIVSQEDQQNSLMELTRENQARIEGLNEEKTRLKAQVEEIKYTGTGGRTGARKMVDMYEEKLTVSSTKLERAKDKYERLARILINVKAGIDHLCDKLESVREGPPLRMSDDTIVDVMYQCEQTLVQLLGGIKTAQRDTGMTFATEVPSSPPRALEVDGEAPTSPVAKSPEPGAASASAVASLGISETDIAHSRPNNTRIQISMGDAGEHDDDEDDDDEPDVGGDDETMTRHKIKLATTVTLTAQKKSMKKQKRAMRRGGPAGEGAARKGGRKR